MSESNNEEEIIEEEIIKEEIIKEEIIKEEIIKESLDINKNIEKKINTSRMYSDIKNSADTYLINEGRNKSIFSNIGAPILKIGFVLIFSLLLVNFLQGKINTSNKYSNISGSWQDEYKNYYEIYNNTFEMNAGNPDNPFYEGTITNIVENDKGYTILVEGIKYKLNNDGSTTYEKPLNIVFKIINYTKDIETIMTANMGTENFDIVRLDTTIKKNR